MLGRRPRKQEQPQGVLDRIDAAEHRLVALPWKGLPCGIVKVRRLSDIETQAIGNFSLIETDSYKWSKARVKTQWSEVLAYAQKNVCICKAALVSPTYDDIFAAVGNRSFNAEVKAQIQHINQLLESMSPGPARAEAEGIRDALTVAWEVILPEDFVAGVIQAALGTDETDIKKVTEDMLYQAAVLADRGGKAPHEYIHGIFSDFNIRDIDNRAWIVYDERVEELREEAKQTRSGR